MASGVERTRPVVGREAELSAVEDFLARAGHGPCALLFQGDAGIGKSTLWRHTVDRASELGFRVLATRPAEPEARLSFTGLGDLLDGQLEPVLGGLPRPQRRALETALLLTEGDGGTSHHALGPALLSSLRLLGEHGPVLIAVDDRQWLDPPSAAVLHFASRRLTDERIGLAFATLTGPSTSEERSARDDLPTMLLELGPLRLGAIHQVIQTRLGLSLPRPALRRVVEVSGGNPFYALELARALARSGTHEVAVPENLQELVLGRVSGLPTPTEDALLVLSSLSRPTVGLLRQALPTEPLETALQPAVDAALIEVERDRVHFTQPLLASAIYAAAAPDRRRDVHRALAEIVRDPEERARHVALATIVPDRAVARVLDEGAAHASSRGATDSAAELAELALSLTPSDDTDGTRDRRVAAAEYHFEGGNSARALTLLEEALAAESSGRARVVVLSKLARIKGEVEGPAAASLLLSETLREGVDDPALEAAIRQRLGRLTMLYDVRVASKHSAAAVELAERSGDSLLLAQALASSALIDFRLGRGTRPALMKRALELEADRPEVSIDDSPSAVRGAQLLATGDLDTARTTFQRLHARAVEQEDASALTPLFYLGLIEIDAGHWERAEEHVAEALAIARQSGRAAAGAPCLAAATGLAAARGEVERTRRLAAETIAVSVETLQPFWAAQARCTLGLLELSLGNAGGAHDEIAPSLEFVLRMGVREPGLLPALPDDVEALALLGRPDEAEALLEPFERRARRLRRASALAAAARGRALIALGQGDEAITSAEEAVERAGALPLPLEHGRALLVLGTAQRRDRRLRAARETLAGAAAVFDELGSPLWAARVAEELAHIGGRRRAEAGELTAAERKVAELVAAGRSNKEVAAELFLTARTVEGHLTRIYEKLGIRSRSELARAFAEAVPDDERTTKDN